MGCRAPAVERAWVNGSHAGETRWSRRSCDPIVVQIMYTYSHFYGKPQCLNGQPMCQLRHASMPMFMSRLCHITCHVSTADYRILCFLCASKHTSKGLTCPIARLDGAYRTSPPNPLDERSSLQTRDGIKRVINTRIDSRSRHDNTLGRVGRPALYAHPQTKARTAMGSRYISASLVRMKHGVWSDHSQFKANEFCLVHVFATTEALGACCYVQLAGRCANKNQKRTLSVQCSC
jgi:hypothetical protein